MGQRGRGVIAGAAALFAVALLAGGVAGQDSATSTPTVIELISSGIEAEGGGLIKDGLVDADGVEVGSAVWDCTNVEDVAWPCRVIISLGPDTPLAEGSIVLDGLFDGYNGESLAITGGTGAYAQARGAAILSVTDAGFAVRLELVA